jgi:acid phosphatase (class A)
MMMTRAPMFAALLLVSACAAGPAAPPPAPPTPTTLAAPDVLKLLPPAPVPGSAADKQDVAAVLDLQAKRTQAMCDFAQGDVDLSLKRFLAPLGYTLNGDTIQTDQLIAMMSGAMRSASDISKNLYKRPRPYDYNAGIVACITKVPPSSYSYPSGHAALGYLMAAMLTQIVPESQAKWYDRATEFGRSRVVGGVHFPSDIEAGRIMGLILAERALRDPAVNAQLELAKPELRRALGF